MDPEAEIAVLREEVAQLKAFVTEIASKQGGDGGFGTDMGLPMVPVGSEQGTFRWEGDKITHCNFYAAHRVVELADVTIQQGQADGTWYLNVPHGNLSSAAVSKTEGQNNDDNTSVKLFTIENGEIKKDYRGMPFIPIYA